MSFIKGFYIPKPEELINNSFQYARKEAEKIFEKDKSKYITEKEITRIKATAEYATKALKKIVTEFPSIDKLNPLYSALIGNSINIVDLKKALSHINTSCVTINHVKTNCLVKTRNMNEMRTAQLRGEFYGRVNSVIKRLKGSLEIVTNAMKIIADIPQIKNLPVCLVIGTPNVGKSTFLKVVTNANVEIKNYPFTTKRLQIGAANINYLDFQLVDSPGILDRPEEKQNSIEKQTSIALKTIANSFVFVVDVSQELEVQKKVFKNILKQEKAKPFFVVFNKIDVLEKTELEEYKKSFLSGLKIKAEDIFETNMNSLTTEQIEEIKQKVYKLNKEWYKNRLKKL